MYQAGGLLAFNYGNSPWMTPEQAQFHGALNGALSGYRKIYSFDAEGVAAFFLDSTHGITGTAIGNYINVFNMSLASVDEWDTDFDEDMSEGSNAHVYQGGCRLMDGMPTPKET